MSEGLTLNESRESVSSMVIVFGAIMMALWYMPGLIARCKLAWERPVQALQTEDHYEDKWKEWTR